MLAANIAARIAGRPTRDFRHVSKGAMATTGHLKGVAQLLGLRLAGLPAWLLWRAYYLLQMPTLGPQVRASGSNGPGRMFFAADITHLRFTRTDEADADARTAAARRRSAAPPRSPTLEESPCSSRNPPSSPAPPAASAWASPAPSPQQGADVMLNGFGNADEIEFDARRDAAPVTASRCATRAPT